MNSSLNRKPPKSHYIIKFGGAVVGAIFLVPYLSLYTYLLVGLVYCSVAHYLWLSWIKKTYSMSIVDFGRRMLIAGGKETQKSLDDTDRKIGPEVVNFAIKMQLGVFPPLVGIVIWPGELLHDVLGEIFPTLKHPYLRGPHPDIVGETNEG